MSTSLAKAHIGADAVIAELLRPDMALPRGVEDALLGSSMQELGGLPPQLVEARKIQHRLILHMLETLQQRVMLGQREELRGAIQFALNVIGGQLLGVLAKVAQHRGDRVDRLHMSSDPISRSLDSFLDLMDVKVDPLKRAERQQAEIEAIITNIRSGVERLMNEVRNSFLVDASDEIRSAASSLASLRILIGFIDDALKGVYPEGITNQACLESTLPALQRSLESSAEDSTDLAGQAQFRIARAIAQGFISSGERVSLEERASRERACAELRTIRGALGACAEAYKARIGRHQHEQMSRFLRPQDVE